MRAMNALRLAGDLDRAIKSIATSRTGKESLASLLSTRARIQYLNGDYVTALNDLDNAIRSDLSKADTFPNSGATKPEQTASVCTWTQPDWTHSCNASRPIIAPICFADCTSTSSPILTTTRRFERLPLMTFTKRRKQMEALRCRTILLPRRF